MGHRKTLTPVVFELGHRDIHFYPGHASQSTTDESACSSVHDARMSPGSRSANPSCWRFLFDCRRLPRHC
jgi:hypothetical protein